MVSGKIEETALGSPQGGVIGPLLANIYLDYFDQFMKSRNYRIIRYTDDILILCGSEKSAKHALDVAENYLEKEMKLKVNQTKTHITHSGKGVKYLGVKIFTGYTQIQKDKLKGFKEKVKFLTRKSLFKELMTWIRRRLRAVQLALWKRPKKLLRKLRQRGISGKFYYMRMNRWRTSKCQ
jgi:hypothetical protein